MTQRVQSMTNRTLSGLLWTSLATGANVLSLFVVLVILARLLKPADFGLAAAALLVIGFSAIFSEFGIGPAVVQRPDLQTAHLRTGFTLSLLLGLLVGALTWLTAPVIADFFRLEELTPMLRILALIFPVQSFAVVADSLLQRELRFRSLGVVDVVTVVAGYGGVGVSLALLGFGAWALVGAHLTQMVLKTALLLCIRPHPAWPLLERRACVDLTYFGGGFTASRFSNFVAGQGENFVIGHFLGAVALGVYGRAYQLMAAPAVLFGNVLDRVLFPAMVHMQHQPKRLADAYRRGNAVIALVIMPVSVVLVVLAPEVIQVVLGPDWEAVTLPLQILGVGMLFRTGCKISDSLVRATGAVYRRTWRQTTYAAVVLAGAWVGQNWGIEGVAVAVLLSLAVNFFLMAQLGLALVAMSWRTFAAAHLPGLALGILVGVPVAVTAEVLRAWDWLPLLVLVTSMAAALPFLIAVPCLPGLFLGPDGQWTIRKLRDFLFPAAQPQSHEGNQSVSDVMKAGLLPAASPHTTNGNGSYSCKGGGPLLLLTRNLASKGIRYCRWKMQLDLQRVLSGAGDLDLLVDSKDAEAFLHVAEGLGFKKVIGCFERARAQDIHLYGLDQETGALLHLHVNFSLLAEKSCLRHMVPSLDQFVLRHCSSEEIPGLWAGMPVVQAPAALLVFVLLTMEQYARLGAYPRLTANRRILQAKVHALLTADPEQSWRGLSEIWLPSVAPTLVAECLAALRQPTSWLRRFLLARKLLKQLKHCTAITSSKTAGCQGRDRKGAAAIPLSDEHKGARPGPSSQSSVLRMPGILKAGWWRLWHGRGSPKQLPSGGAVIAIIGPDASGKSTMVAETTKWLGQVFRVQTAHLGKPPSTWLTWLPNLAGRLLTRAAPQLRTINQHAVSGGASSGGQGVLYRLRAVLLAWDRRALALRLSRKAARGWFIVCDRYPSVVVGAPDSARLKAPEDEPGQTWLRAYLARLENRLYRGVPLPDVVMRLSAPLAIAIDRNKERQKAGKESDDYIARRHKEFFVPHFVNTQIIEIDTNKSQAESVEMLRKLLWRGLCWPARHGSPSNDKIPNSHDADGVEEAPVELQKR